MDVPGPFPERFPEQFRFPGLELLRTRRLRMRGLRLEDMHDILRLDRSERVHALLLDARARTLLEAAAVVILVNRVYRQHPGLGVWYTTDERGEFIGLFSLMPVEDSGEVEIGTRLLPSAWGRNYPVEGGRALCEYAFATLGLPALVGLCHPDNRAVPLILRRLGFSAAGQTLHFGRPALRFELKRQRWRPESSRPTSAGASRPPGDE
jgi:RimJ/RimL family protein N-acetyltransferase